MRDTIRLAIADDHLLFRKGLVSILGTVDDMQVIYEADNGHMLLQQMQEQVPDVVLMDVKMPVMDGIEATEKVKELYPDVRVIVLSMYDEDEFIIRLISKGACSYLLKNAEPSEVVRAIRSVYDKGRYFSDQVADVLARGVAQRQNQPEEGIPEVVLSTREIEVIQLMAREFTNQQIGEILHLSARTVEGHRKRIQDKIGAKNMAGIIVYAVKRGIIE